MLEELLARLRNINPNWGSNLERMQLRFAADYIEIGMRSSSILRDIEIISVLSRSPELRDLATEAMPALRQTVVNPH